ncbi:CaiB/BaiF CoA transferase family protein [Chloroflexota bacterium]
MVEKEKTEGMLSPYRVLDLTDDKGLFCGKLLGDLGADVIKVERLGGDTARNIGPFYHDEVDPEKSLFWFALNTSKRGITLDIETAEGQDTLKKLVKNADFVIESSMPGYLDKLGLGYSALEKINPGIIMVSITPFGQTGPYKDYKGADIVGWAMGGHMYVNGDLDRAPVRISHPYQAYFHGGSEGAVGAMMALHYRQMTGEGQHVDVSIQESVIRAADTTIGWDTNKVIRKRSVIEARARITTTWPCKDGEVTFTYWSGPRALRYNSPMIAWLEKEGMDVEFVKALDWTKFDFREATQDIVDKIEKPTRDFFMSHTKAELLDGAVKNDVTLYPLSTTNDMLENVQLAARKYWVKLEHPELGTTITYTGAFGKASEAPIRVSRRAPLIGEHNKEILEEEINLSDEELLALKKAKGYPGISIRKGEGKKLLEGVKVANFSSALVGPFTTKPIADCGAEMIQIESKTRPDAIMRMARPFRDRIQGINRGAYFNREHTNNLSLDLNLAKPKAVEIAKKVVSWADVVVENFAGGAMDRMGLGYETLKKVKPDIIMLSSCMQGQTGPYAKHPGYGRPLTALTGFAHIAGWPDRNAAELNVYTDFVAPHFNALAILAAIDYKYRTGKGQYIDCAQYEGCLHFMEPFLLDYAVNNRVASRVGNRSYYGSPHGAFRCLGEDRWCAIAVFTDEEWESLCKVIGKPELTKNPKFASFSARKENEDELEKLINEWTVNYPAEEVMSMVQAGGVAAGVLETGEDMMDKDPQLKHRNFFVELDHPETGKYRPERPPYLFSKVDYELRPAPLLGEHNEYVLKEILGMSDEEMVELVIEEVIG